MPKLTSTNFDEAGVMTGVATFFFPKNAEMSKFIVQSEQGTLPSSVQFVYLTEFVKTLTISL